MLFLFVQQGGCNALITGALPLLMPLLWRSILPVWSTNVSGQEILAPAKSGVLKFDDLADIIKELNEHYGHWQDGECQILSRELQELEDQCPGHVSLHRFYAAQLYHDKWQFSESAEYLRSLGALEDGGCQNWGTPKICSLSQLQKGGGPKNIVPRRMMSSGRGWCPRTTCWDPTTASRRPDSTPSAA